MLEIDSKALEKVQSLEELSRLREETKDKRLKETDAKKRAREAEYKKSLLAKLVAPALFMLTVLIGLILWLMAR